MLGKIFEPFIEASSVSVIARAAMERTLSPDWANRVFEATAIKQYTRTLLFSSVLGLMVRVVLGQRPSIRAAYLSNADTLDVSLTSIYNKLQGIDTATSASMVSESAKICAEMIAEMGGLRPEWLPGYNIRIVDGNCIASTEHRIKELRDVSVLPTYS